MNGASTEPNSLGLVTVATLGTACWAAVNRMLVDGVGTGTGGTPKFGAVVVTTGSVPMLGTVPSLGTSAAAAVGVSWLPALSVASARNW